MILADTSVWVAHFRGTGNVEALPHLLEADLISVHPAVLGELALGRTQAREQLSLADLERLPTVALVPDREVLELIVERGLAGRGIGWVDAHLLASALVEGCELWTLDGRLAEAARSLGISTADDLHA